MCLIPDARTPVDHAVRFDDDIIAQDYFVTDDNIRSNPASLADLRARTDDG